MHALHRWLLITAVIITGSDVRAELVSLKILQREPFAGGKAFADVGPYEQIMGIARFAIDPQDERNRVIVDIDLAPKNADGKVEFASDVVILAPKDLAKGNGAIFYDVNNRGNKLALGMFNRPPGGPALTKENPAGDGFLMRKGYTIVWSGWIGELLPGDGRLLLQAPQARKDGKLLRGFVRQETSSDTKVKSMPLSRRPNHGSYPPTKEGEAKAVLTKRMHEPDKRDIVPRDQWKLVRMPLRGVKEGVPGTLPEIRLELEAGYEPGVLYELVYEGEGSLVQGVGFASVRDLVSFLRHDVSDKNPLRKADGKPAISRTLSFGVSQSGRFLRHLLYQGFNEDEKGRIVFDGLIPHVAGGGLGFFNHRFAQPNRHNGQHEDHLFPGDRFPFAYSPLDDPLGGVSKSLLSAYEFKKEQPKIMHTQSVAEYWHRAGSLVHTNQESTADVAPPANVRIYAFGGTQHGPGAFPPSKGIADNYANFADYRPLLRGLLVALDEWVRVDKAPPASLYPRLADKSLVRPFGGDLFDESPVIDFPKIPGVRFPKVIQRPFSGNYGGEFLRKGIITIEPPTESTTPYNVLVPNCDADGNDKGMLLPPEVAVPLGTYTGWNLRRKEFGADGALASLQGSFIPFPLDDKTKDPRTPLSKRYKDAKFYCQQLDDACERLVNECYMLEEDRPRYGAYGTALWNFVMKK